MCDARVSSHPDTRVDGDVQARGGRRPPGESSDTCTVPTVAAQAGSATVAMARSMPCGCVRNGDVQPNGRRVQLSGYWESDERVISYRLRIRMSRTLTTRHSADARANKHRSAWRVRAVCRCGEGFFVFRSCTASGAVGSPADCRSVRTTVLAAVSAPASTRCAVGYSNE